MLLRDVLPGGGYGAAVEGALAKHLAGCVESLQVVPQPSGPASRLGAGRGARLRVTHLEWSGVQSEIEANERLHSLLLKLAAIAMIEGDWIRAVDRLELLLKISAGKFRPAEAHFRCGYAYSRLATDSQGKQREEFLEVAQEHLWRASKENPHDEKIVFYLANVQLELGKWGLARENYERAIKIQPDYARAKYNLAICRLKLEGAKTAFEGLQSIRAEDRDAAYLGKRGLEDDDLKPLLDDPEHGASARLFLSSLSQAQS